MESARPPGGACAPRLGGFGRCRLVGSSAADRPRRIRWRPAMPLAAPVMGAAGVRRQVSAGDLPGVQGASQGSALAGRACRGFTAYAFDERSWAGHDRKRRLASVRPGGRHGLMPEVRRQYGERLAAAKGCERNRRMLICPYLGRVRTVWRPCAGQGVWAYAAPASSCAGLEVMDVHAAAAHDTGRRAICGGISAGASWITGEH